MKKLIILSGPTAAGKTELSINLAKKIGGEIISADSMQVYKYMDIGTAKISPQQMGGIKHYLVDELEPSEEFSVNRFQSMAKAAMEEIYQKGKIPILVGGTGFYIQSILYDIDFTENQMESGAGEIRKELTEYLEQNGPAALHELLKQIDEPAANQIHENNTKRVIRAIEFYRQTGTRISEHNEKERAKASPYNFAYFVLNLNRDKLYKRIESRIDKMLSDGLVDEVKSLKNMGYSRDDVAMQGLGYKEILDYLDGKISLSDAVYVLKRDTRHFAKRQLTWFRRERDAIWIDKDAYQSEDDILSYMEKELISRGII